MNSDPSPKPNELVRTPRKNQASFKSEKIDQQLTEPVDQENNGKQNQKIRDWCQLILVCAIVVLMTIVVIEHSFTKDDTLLTLIASMFSLVIGYHFSLPKTK